MKTKGDTLYTKVKAKKLENVLRRECMEEVLNKAYWNLSDIQAYLGCGVSKASKIRQIAIKKFNGLNPLLPQKVKRDSVLKVLQIKE